MPTFRLLPDLEEAIRHLPGVRAASVVTNAEKVPVEVHVLAAPGKPARHVVRDVQSLAMARYDIDLDHRIVSVVLLADEDVPVIPAALPTTAGHGAAPVNGSTDRVTDEPDVERAPVEPVSDYPVDVGPEPAPTAAPLPTLTFAPPVNTGPPVVTVTTADDEWAATGTEVRPVISAIMVRTAGAEAEATVSLAAGGKIYEGRVVGSGAPTHRARLVAQATLVALGELLDTTAEVEDAFVHDTGSRLVALTVLSVTVPRLGPQAVSGSAIVRTDEADAVARSVLDAVNRRLTVA